MEQARARLPELEVREWDLLARPDLGVRYGVMSTPAIVINGRLEFTGVPKTQAFLSRLEALAAEGGTEPVP